MRRADWNRRRNELEHTVLRSISSINSDFQLKGSFQNGDFHLSRDGRSTFSDIDLLLAPDGRDRHEWESEVEDAIRSRGWCVRVSVQRFDSLGSPTAADSRLLTLGECLRFKGQLDRPEFASYLCAKTILRIHGSLEGGGELQRWLEFHQAQCRINSARTGYVRDFTADEAERLLMPIGGLDPSITHIVNVMQNRDVARAVRWFKEQLRTSLLHPWLASRMEYLVEESLTDA